VTQEARKRWLRKLDRLLAEEPVVSSAAQRFELSEQIAECRTKLAELDEEDCRRALAHAEPLFDYGSNLDALLELAKQDGLLLRTVPIDATGTSQVFAGAAMDSAPLSNAVLADALSQRIARDFARIRECYLSGDRAAAIAELNAQIQDQVWPHLAASLRGRLLRTAALYRLDFGQDQAGAEALAERAAEEDPGGDDQGLAAHLALRRGESEAALALLKEPRSLQARHLKAAMLIEGGDAEAGLAALDVPVELAEGGAPHAVPSGDPTDAAGNTAETWRLRALAHLAMKRLPDAIEAVDAARTLSPDWISVRGVAAVVDFWRSCTPAALALTEQPLWPMPFTRALVRADADAGARLAEIEQTFATVAAATPEGSGEQGHWLTWRLIALLAAGDRRDAATELARRLIGDDGPPHIWPLVWDRFFGLDTDRGRLKERLKSIPSEDPNFIPFTGLYLELRLEDGEVESLLIELEEIATIVEALGHPEATRQWRVLALTAAGRLDEAGSAADEIVDERLRLRMRLHIARSQEAEAPGSHKAAAATLFAIDPALDVLAEACEAHAKAGDWDFVATHAGALLDAIPTPGSLQLLAIAAFNRGDYRRCMSALDEHRDVYPDGRLPNDLALVRVRCQRMLGDSSEAAREARRLWQQDPTAVHLEELIDSAIQGGDLAGARQSLRRMLAAEDASAETLLRAVNLAAVAGDRELATLLWRRAGELGSDAPDFSGWMAFAGSHLGLGQETAPWLERMAAEARAGIGSAKAVRLPELLDLMREQREAGERVERLYRTGQVPVHLLPEHLFPPLARLFHELPKHNRAEYDPLLDVPVLVRHGALPLPEIADGGGLDGRLVLDITAVLTACDLGLLDKVEDQFAPLWLTPNWHPTLLNEIRRLTPGQPERIEVQRRVADLVRAGGIAQVDLKSLSPPESLADLVGGHNAHALEQVRAENGFLVDFLPLSRHEREDLGSARLPPEWSDHVIGPRRLLDCAAGDGIIDAAAHERGAEHFAPEADDGKAVVRAGDYLLVCPEVLIALAQAEVLNLFVQVYRLAVAKDLWQQVEAELTQDDANAALVDWLRALIDRLSAGLQGGTYRNAPSGAPSHKIVEQPTHGLDDLLRFPGERGDLLWIDDRLLSSYRQSGVCRVIGIVDLIGMLPQCKGGCEPDRFDWLARLRTGNYQFIPLAADEILHWLEPGRTNSKSGLLVVPPQLEAVARYWAACLYQGDALKWTGNDRHGQGEIPFFVSSQSAISRVLRTIWSDDRLNLNRRRQRADWVLNNLHVGVGDVPHLGPEPSPERDMNLVGMDLAALCFEAVQMMVERASRDRKLAERDKTAAKRARDRALTVATDYLTWICDRAVAPRLLADPRSAATTAAAFRSLLLGSFAGDHEELLPVVGSWLVRFLPILPSVLREELHKDQDLMQRLGLQQVASIQVDALSFRALDLWPAVQTALRGLRPIVLDSEWQQPFGLSQASGMEEPRLMLELTDAGGRVIGRHRFQFSELLLDSREQRIQALRSNPCWWDGDLRGAEGVERDLSVVDSAASRVREIRRIMARSADAHYIELEQELLHQRQHRQGLPLKRCFPPPLSAVLNYIRCNETNTDVGSLAPQCWDTLVRSIPIERGLSESLHRISLLPCPLPDAVPQSLAALDEESRREVLKLAAPGMAHAVGHLHTIDLLLASAGTLPEALNLAQDQIDYLSTSHFADELRLTHILVDLAYRAFGTEAEENGIEPRRQLLAAWAHAARITIIMRWAGVDLDNITTCLRQWAPFPYRDLYAEGHEPTSDLAWPWHTEMVDLIFAGLGRVLSRYPVLAPQLDLTVLQVRLELLDAGASEAIRDAHLLRDTGLLTDILGCLWGGDRSVNLAPLIGLEKASRFSSNTFSGFVDACLDDLAVNPERAEHWRALYLTVRQGVLPSPNAKRLDGILTRLDFDALIASDHLLLRPLMDLSVRHRCDPKPLVAQIYRWAEGIDTGDQPTPAFREKFGAEASRLFIEQLIDWLHTLASRHPEDPDGEFARLLDGLILRSRTLAAELRGPLLNLTRHLPFSRHRALRRTLLAARARPGPVIGEACPQGPERKKQATTASRNRCRKNR